MKNFFATNVFIIQTTKQHRSMIKKLCIFLLLPFLGMSQPITTAWKMNNNGQKATFWQPSGNPPNITYTYMTTNDSADMIKVCYSVDSVWTYSHGMTYNMGKYMNPGACSSQVYVYRFPITPSVPTTKVISPKIGAIGCLLNGIPIYGLGDSKSWNGSSNVNMGSGVWNVEVYQGEGVSLDTAFSAHPQQQGVYHSHAKPRRLYQSTPTSVHSPIVGFAFDGYPVYGPYGYSVPTNSTSAVARMKSGYGLRNITTRTTLPYGVTASQAGPAVSTTYPLGTYCEDYEWDAANGGDLDKYNGRFCVTPEYPGGTYAYFVTIDASGTPQFPYYIGIEYYGAPDQKNFTVGGASTTGLHFPSSGTNCIYGTGIENVNNEFSFAVYPNPTNGNFTVHINRDIFPKATLEVLNLMGEVIYRVDANNNKLDVILPSGTAKGIYFARLVGTNVSAQVMQKIVVE
jgi:hypothetical protein